MTIYLFKESELTLKMNAFCWLVVIFLMFKSIKMSLCGYSPSKTPFF
jgi:hypothetical protein